MGIEGFVVNADGSCTEETLRATGEQIYGPAGKQDNFPLRTQLRTDRDQEVVENNSSMMWTILKQLKIGADMTHFSQPAFLMLERSSLDRMAEYCRPTVGMLGLHKEQDPIKRLLAVAQWVLEPMADIPQNGMDKCKPFNPILYEQFHCVFEHPTSTTVLVSEAVSHHPPIQAAILYNTEAKYLASFSGRATPVFMGNYAMAKIEGEVLLHVWVWDETKRQYAKETYECAKPYLTVKGLFIGPVKTDVSGGALKVSCAQTGLSLHVDLKNCGDMYGKIKTMDKSKTKLMRVVGNLSEQAYTIDLRKNPKAGKNGPKDGELWLDFSTSHTRACLKTVQTPVHEQHELESRRVWHAVSYALSLRKYDEANDYKDRIEEHQRKLRKQPGWKGPQPQLFDKTSAVKDGCAVYRYRKYDQVVSMIEASLDASASA